MGPRKGGEYNEIRVSRRLFLLSAGLLRLAGFAFASVQGLSIRGKLTQSAGQKPALETGPNKLVYLEGDQATQGVLNDKRLWGTDFEAVGHFNAPDRFEIDPIHTRSMFVHKDGKRLMITYWCDVCYIRTYTPGTCVCCQKYTDLDLRESIEP
jgi:hypothetical protein